MHAVSDHDCFILPIPGFKDKELSFLHEYDEISLQLLNSSPNGHFSTL